MGMAVVKAAGAAGTEAAPLPAQLEGRLDAVSGGRVYGWAWDRARPSEPVEVEIRLDGHVLARVTADLPRPDLEAGGLGNGRHAFEAELPADMPGEPDLHALAAVAVSPATGAQSALAIPEPGEREQAATLVPQLDRLGAVILAVRREQGQLSQGQQSLLRGLRELGTRLPAPGQPGAAQDTAKAIEDLARGQRELAERIAGLEVFLVRMDETLGRFETGIRGTAASGRGQAFTPAMALGAIGALTLAGLTALLISLS